jgi:hypothetical protein
MNFALFGSKASNSTYIFFIHCGITVMMFNATFNSISVISWRSVLLVEETGTYALCMINTRTGNERRNVGDNKY